MDVRMLAQGMGGVNRMYTSGSGRVGVTDNRVGGPAAWTKTDPIGQDKVKANWGLVPAG